MVSSKPLERRFEKFSTVVIHLLGVIMIRPFSVYPRGRAILMLYVDDNLLVITPLPYR